ncbi:hypothetical protein F4779DRAFT_618085 [Xylariaceae sp. FL0662B]|nr:hypothetical protein F4779DRAFT_618085 [Xylariaceae sp. FL0662B]
MSRTLEPTLLSLLPSYSQDLPQPLLELASLLLTQSHHSASALKAEEEVARAYVCAHIACERLKISLDLPPIQVRPPIPPRIYKRLYSHLDNVLPASPTKRTRTPSNKLRESGIFGSAQRIPSRGTPTKDESLAKFRSPTTTRGSDNTPTKSTGKPPPLPTKKKAGGALSALPAWIRPTTQFICKELDEERAGRTVLAGMQTIVAPHGRRTKDEWVNQHLTPLLAAVYFFVISQFYVLEQGKKLDNSQYVRIRKSILNVLGRVQDNVAVTGMDEDELWIGWTDIRSKDVDGAVAKVVGSGWQKDEWFAGIRQMAKTVNPEEGDDNVDKEDGEERIRERLHVQRGDTMLQSRWDITDKKKEEYSLWKEGILRQIEAIEHARGPGMGVDAAV